MFENTKCECGHQNHIGTVLCEACGKPLYDEEGTAPLEMRYDGVARRSQKEHKGIFDQVWSFFSSVKVAVYLIIITLLGSALGTIYPQENTFFNIDPSVFYKQKYGWTGEFYYKIGLTHTYNSWWFVTLLFMIGTSLVVCSLDRVLPLYRALTKQKVRKHTSFILRQKVAYSGGLPTSAESAETWVEQAEQRLRRHRYRVHREGTALLAEKYRFSRWGPYINHIGLIIFLLAALARSIPGWHMDQYIGFLEGEPVKIPNTPYFLKNEKFTVEYYSPDEMSKEFRQKDRIVPKVYETDAVLYQCTDRCDTPDPDLKEVHRQSIKVNEPLSYKGLFAYQFDFQQTPTLLGVTPSLRNKQTGQEYGKFHLSMKNPQTSYQAGPYKLEVKGYFPDFGLDDNGSPITKSNNPNAPAFIFNIIGPGTPADGDVYLYFARQIDRQTFRQDDINGAVGKQFDISAASMNDVEIATYTSYLNIRVDRALPYIWVGAAISMIGLVMGFYWQHRRIWLRVDDGELSVGAHTNKNWFGIRKEVAAMLNETGIPADAKALDASAAMKQRTETEGDPS